MLDFRPIEILIARPSRKKPIRFKRDIAEFGSAIVKDKRIARVRQTPIQPSCLASRFSLFSFATTTVCSHNFSTSLFLLTRHIKLNNKVFSLYLPSRLYFQDVGWRSWLFKRLRNAFPWCLFFMFAHLLDGHCYRCDLQREHSTRRGRSSGPCLLPPSISRYSPSTFLPFF